ncbi:alpha/beta fold hydrolase [Anaerobranca gottschalkii]|uniref:Pimeloyl-ACP methyl ester carboxylesterase n=1 Tax=Anaerobranca gottschalkii DSM 13577 TaxID=1120990 RepID=A0A1I0AFC1_9FIRM|nr:alpha/beta hydrolase [Anaerobranca gottschalkii]SES92380.1 Pimeloyl-ACP methyl ester carboxylesterase [Anaerobranca gottschalkii DSM 13577]
MPKIQVNDIQMYYEIHGEGTPLVLIEGLGYATWMWYKQIDELAKHFQVIVFDNRGVGETDKPDCEYTIEMFADDLAELLSKLGIEKAHILGVSMGGFIAQEFALKYPHMVDKLILCSTSFGGPNSIPIPMETLQIMLKGGGVYTSLDEIKEAIATALDKDNLNEEVLNKIMEEKMKDPQPKYAYQRQLMAGAGFNAENRVEKIKSETLILAGKGDRVVPPENAVLLKEKIPCSKMIIIEKAGHVFFMEQPEETNKAIIDFLK